MLIRISWIYFLFVLCIFFFYFLFHFVNLMQSTTSTKALRERSRVFSSCGLTQKWEYRVDPRRFFFWAILFILLISCSNGICERPKGRTSEAEPRWSIGYQIRSLLLKKQQKPHGAFNVLPMDRVARPCLNLAGFKTMILAGFCSADYNLL
jgi:hypothetical protein